ncbi:MAG TPA: 5-oxoprolinase/urea amidolyase family protein [Streptosporangiaceae bacterium]|jgi:KipI family sensor histidine kinase inhibitor
MRRTVRPAGDASLLVCAGDEAAALAAAVRALRLPGVLDVIPGASTVLVTTEPGSWDLTGLAARLSALAPLPTARLSASEAEIPVVYDGADLADVARLTGLDVDGVIAAHEAAAYTVGWLGFSPGFGYLTGLDAPLNGVPRLDRPRQSVPAGSVAIAGGLSAVYPVAAPGGWRLLGRTAARLWDPSRNPPALLSPGMRVRFREVRSPDVGSPDADSADAGSDAGSEGPADQDASTAAGRTGAPGRATAGDGTGAGGSLREAAGLIEVLRPGPLATIQDLGRPGLGHLGVPASGAADAASLRLANLLAGNPAGAAGIEFTLGHAELLFHVSAVVAVTGAPVRVAVRAGPAGRDAEMPFATSFIIQEGSVLSLGSPPAGLRSYLAVHGGIDCPAVLGSRSADLLSALGPGPLRAGDLLPAGLPGPAGPAGPAGAAEADLGPELAGVTAQRLPGRGEVAVLRALPGPRDDWFSAAAMAALTAGTYSVTPASNRTGLRLAGQPLARQRGGELPSEGVVTGSLQVPPDGQPILLLADHQVTGGYPVIAVVRSADVGRAAQLRPGQAVRFELS